MGYELVDLLRYLGLALEKMRVFLRARMQPFRLHHETDVGSRTSNPPFPVCARLMLSGLGMLLYDRTRYGVRETHQVVIRDRLFIQWPPTDLARADFEPGPGAQLKKRLAQREVTGRYR
jgi:hypothetical protein